MPKALVAALEDDLNTPKAFAELFALARAANASADEGERRELKGQLLAGGSLLGLLRQDPGSGDLAQDHRQGGDRRSRGGAP